MSDGESHINKTVGTEQEEEEEATKHREVVGRRETQKKGWLRTLHSRSSLIRASPAYPPLQRTGPLPPPDRLVSVVATTSPGW